jgi:hypothetical protein
MRTLLWLCYGLVLCFQLFHVHESFAGDNRVQALRVSQPAGGTGYIGLSASYLDANSVSITITQCTMSGLQSSQNFSSVNVSASLGNPVGANGPDVSTLDSASRWLYYWTIGKPDGTVAGLFSATCNLTNSNYSPTMPAGYTYKRCWGAVRNDGSSNFGNFMLKDTRTTYLDSSTARQLLNAGSAYSAPTSVDCSAFVPPIVTRVYWWGIISGSDSTWCMIGPVSGQMGQYGDITANLRLSNQVLEMTDQTFYYQWTNNGATKSMTMYMTGFDTQL